MPTYTLTALWTGGDLAPTAPELIEWESPTADAYPKLIADFDNSRIWYEWLIDASNYDVVHVQFDTVNTFDSPDAVENTLAATELLEGRVQFTVSPLSNTTWYSRVRHEHVVNDSSFFSDWSNTLSKVISA